MSQLRTVLVVLVGYLFTFIGLRSVMAWTHGQPGEHAASVAVAYFSAIGFLAAAIALKSALQHAAGGGGVLGALGAILTQRKPEPPPPEAKP